MYKVYVFTGNKGIVWPIYLDFHHYLIGIGGGVYQGLVSG